MSALLDVLAEAWRGLARWPVRTGLPMLGIAVGTAALIAIVSADRAWEISTRQSYVDQPIANIRIALPQGEKLRRYFLTVEDAEALKSGCAGLGDVAWASLGGATVHLPGQEHASVTTFAVSQDYVRLSGWSLATGREFTPEDFAGNTRVCIVSRLAAKRLADNKLSLGETVRINGYPFSLIGVADTGGQDADLEGMILVPFPTHREILRGSGTLVIEARPRTLALMGPLHDQINQQLGQRLGARSPMISFCYSSWQELQNVLGARVRVRAFLLVAIALLLFTASLGVSVVLVAAIDERSREIACRRALGAGQLRLRSELLTEGMLLVLGGAIAGIIAGVFVTHIICQFLLVDLKGEGLIPHYARNARYEDLRAALSAPALADVALSPGIVMQTLLVVAVTGLVACIIGTSPLARLTPAALAGLSEAPRSRFLIPLTVSQGALGICMTLVLVSIYQGLAREDFSRIRSLFDTDKIIVHKAGDSHDARVQERLLELSWNQAALNDVLARTPLLVTLAGSVRFPSAATVSRRGTFFKHAYDPPKGVTADYFRACTGREKHVLSGRLPTDDEFKRGNPVCVLTTAASRRLFSDASAVGQRVRIGGFLFTVVGVVADSTEGSDFPRVYFPVSAAPKAWFAANPRPTLYGQLRSERDYREGEEQLRWALAERLEGKPPHHDPDNRRYWLARVPAEMLADVSAMTERASYRSAVFGLIALLVAGMGVLNLLLVTVTEDVREIALRRALGATKLQMASAYIFNGLAITLAASVVGGMLAAVVARVLSAITSVPAEIPLRWMVFSAGLLMLIGTTAALIPALLASRVEPAEGLKYE